MSSSSIGWVCCDEARRIGPGTGFSHDSSGAKSDQARSSAGRRAHDSLTVAAVQLAAELSDAAVRGWCSGEVCEEKGGRGRGDDRLGQFTVERERGEEEGSIGLF